MNKHQSVQLHSSIIPLIVSLHKWSIRLERILCKYVPVLLGGVSLSLPSVLKLVFQSYLFNVRNSLRRGSLGLELYSESPVCFDDIIDFLYFSIYIG